MKLSIIIPYYNAGEYTEELMSVLDKQITDDCEVILVDDGSEEPYKTSRSWLKVVRHPVNRGTSAARNTGLDLTSGDYVAFIDADDMIAKTYISNVLKKTEKGVDYIELSWKSLTTNGNQFNCRVTNSQRLQNPSVCTRVFKRSFIGDMRFNELRDAGEDEEFTRRLDLSGGQRDYITPYMYFYRSDVKDSQVKRFKAGRTRTKRIVYHIPKITDPAIIKEIKELDKVNEVYLFCNENPFPELEKYCQISRPFKTWAHELKGEPCNLVEIIKEVHAQVVIYISGTTGYDGLTTFMYNFCVNMKEYYDITILHDYLGANIIKRLRDHVRVIQRDKTKISCDTLLMMRIGDNTPPEVEYKQIYQLVHCTHSDTRELKREPCIFVSEVSKESYNKEGRVIHNIGNPTEPQRSLILMSTSRVGASDKGAQDEKMVALANKLNNEGIPYLWLYFSFNTLKGAPYNMVRIDPVDDVRGFLKRADYLVHLSENEAYCYSITEALELGVPVIVSDIPILKELGFKDKKHGFILNEEFDVNSLLYAPSFKGFKQDNVIESWREVLGNTVPSHDYIPDATKAVKCIHPYKDMQLEKMIGEGEVFEVTPDRADYLKSLNLVEEV